MYALMVTIDIKPGFKGRFIEAMLDDARSSVTKEPGCVRFDVIQDEERPDRIYLYEVYANKAAFDTHNQTPHFIRWRDTVKDWFTSPPVVGKGPNIFPADPEWNRNWKGK